MLCTVYTLCIHSVYIVHSLWSVGAYTGAVHSTVYSAVYTKDNVNYTYLLCPASVDAISMRYALKTRVYSLWTVHWGLFVVHSCTKLCSFESYPGDVHGWVWCTIHIVHCVVHSAELSLIQWLCTVNYVNFVSTHCELTTLCSVESYPGDVEYALYTNCTVLSWVLSRGASVNWYATFWHPPLYSPP